MLITERIGRLRIIRNGVLDPTSVAVTPEVLSRGTMAGLMDIALHPNFAQNQWIYISYHNDNWEELRREALLRDLHQRIRDVRQGPEHACGTGAC